MINHDHHSYLLTINNYSKEVVIPPFILRRGRPGFKMSIPGRSSSDPRAIPGRSLGWIDVGEPPVKKNENYQKPMVFHTCRGPGAEPGGSKIGPCRRD